MKKIYFLTSCFIALISCNNVNSERQIKKRTQINNNVSIEKIINYDETKSGISIITIDSKKILYAETTNGVALLELTGSDINEINNDSISY